jgi:uncharacterized OB-fold protein
MSAVDLSSRGTVETFTIVHQQLTGSVMVPPYAIVRVKLQGGPTIQTVMEQADATWVAIGTPVELVGIPISVDSDGQTIVSFAARPAQGQGGK